MSVSLFKNPCFAAIQGNGEFAIIDGAILVDGIYRTQIYKKTIDECRAEYPGVRIMEFFTAYDLYEAGVKEKYCKPPREVTEERFWDMLEVLPPVSWVRYGHEESFKLSERTIGTITLTCVRIGSKYYEYEGEIGAQHEAIIKHVQAAIAAGTVTKA